MEKHKLQAWGCLTQKEKALLRLMLVDNRSLQEASILVKLRRYKAEEIFLRGKRFFILFTDYFSYNETLFTEKTPLTEPVKKYLELVVLSRLTPRVAAEVVNSPKMYNHQRRAKMLAREMFDLRDSGLTDTFEFIREFDAWNNFRILPKTLWKPSPYIRRQKRLYAQVVRAVSSLTPLGYEVFKKALKTGDPPFIYVPLTLNFLPSGFEIMAIADTFINRSYISRNKLPFFHQKRDAIRAMELIYDWERVVHKKSGLSKIFWNNFRDVMTRASNLELLIGTKDFILTDQQVKELKAIGSLS